MTTQRPAWAAREADATEAWFASVTAWMEQDDDALDALFEEEQRAAHARTDQTEAEFFVPRGMSAEEHRAILDGNKGRLLGSENPWKDVIALMKGPNPSPTFIAVLAAMIEANAFHNRGRRSGRSTHDLRWHRDRYSAILCRAYRRPLAECQRRAADILAHERQKETGETFAVARNKVAGAIERGGQDSTTRKIYRALNARA
ncbi:hypothetical protein [Mesorhizobium sp.]|uniref:hypothetical protein n=1 Tax=Mesorhizobium sp. TaxID=1871066 RepID=UPI00121F16A8|nr:hypothetical protein [Mesorhizobium sp.]TIM48784.1 MAG: hypothetical protein E5Y56_06165 [Mesorhizobium sp.]